MRLARASDMHAGRPTALLRCGVLRSRPGLALAAVWAVWALAGQAWGARVGLVVATAPGAPGPDVVADAVGGPLRARGDEVEARPFATAAARRREGAVERARLEALVRTRGLIEEGWRAYLSAEPAFAEARLGEARLRLLDDLELEGAVEWLADATFRLGAVKLFGGRAGEAAQAFALAARLDPGLAPSPREVSPDVIEAYQRARGAVAGARHAVAVRVGATDGAAVKAAIAVDGGAPGPVGRVELTAGEHLIVAAAPGYRADARLVRVPGLEAVIELELERDGPLTVLDEAARSGTTGDAASTRAALGAAIVFAELDEVFVVGAGFRGGEPTLRGQRCAGVPARCGAVAEILYAVGGERAAAALLVERMKTPGMALGEIDALAGLGVAGAGGKGKPSAWRAAWPWIAVGGAVAVLAAIALVDGGANDPTVRVCVIDGACP